MTQDENVDPCPRKKTKKKEKKRKEKFSIKEWDKAKKGKKIPNQGSEENKRNIQKGLWARYISEQLSPSKRKKKKGNHDLKWPSPFDCQPKSCASVTCSPHTKQKQKRKRPKTLKAKVPTKKKQTIPKKKYY